MSFYTFRSLWGINSSDWESEFALIKSNGFDGVEASLADVGLPSDQIQFLRFCFLMSKYELKWICGIYTGWNDYEFGNWKTLSVADHIIQFKDQVSVLMSLEKDQRPIHLNCHTGCDSFTDEEATECFRVILEEGRKLPMPCSHETHRGRILGSPWACLRMVEKFKDLRITLDISHWNVVAERLIPIEIIYPILSRVDHIHARIGTHEGPQVGNPRDKKNAIFTQYHEKIWKTIWRIGLDSNKRSFTATPEYGPAQDFYMPQVTIKGPDGTFQEYVEADVRTLINDEKLNILNLFNELKV